MRRAAPVGVGVEIFSESDKSVGDVDATVAAMLVAAGADLSLVVDGEGRILDIAVEREELQGLVSDAWRGQAWADTVVTASRARIQELMDYVPAAGTPPLCREITHRAADGSDLPVRYCAVPLAPDGRRVLVGRDLRTITVLKQQLMNAQQAHEQDYWRLRQVETRYRLLFQMADDAVLVVDDGTGKVLEANPAAGRLLGGGRRTMVGQSFPLGLDDETARQVSDLLAEARNMGQATGTVRLTAEEVSRPFTMTAHLIRHENEVRFLVRLAGDQRPAAAHGDQARFAELIRQSPDAVVLTDAAGVIRAANPGFVSLTQLGHSEQAVGQSLERWLGASGVDLNVLLSNLRRHGTVRLFASTLHDEYEGLTEVEISAASFASGDEPLFGIFMRDVGRRLQAGGDGAHPLARSVEQVTERVGRVPLKELVRESTDLIEKLCIEAALELTNNNRASAAELLGLSRQSLYAKLKRYGMGESEGD